MESGGQELFRTNKEHKKEAGGSKYSFKKEVVVNSLAVYWQPRERNIYRCCSYYFYFYSYFPLLLFQRLQFRGR